MKFISNKKGTVFHYALIGIFAALGLAFLFFNQSIGTENFILGQWENNFIDNYLYEGEKVQIQEDLFVNYFILHAINITANNGGYASGTVRGSESDLRCESAFDLPLLNSGSENCFASFLEEISLEFSSLIEARGEEFVDGFEVEIIDNTLNFISEGGIKVLPGDATLDLSDEEINCLEESNLPRFTEGEYSSCGECPSEGSCNYVSQFYCDLDPCENECMSYYNYTNSDWVYSSCDICPEEAECSRYINQYYCEIDACSIGCKWNVNKCEESGITGTNAFSSMDIMDKAKIVSNPDIFTQNTEYTIDYSFSYDLEKYFNDYQEVAIQAVTLLSSCQNSIDLEECLDDEREDNWYYSDCIEIIYQEESRMVPFCVKSPTEISLISLVSGAYDLKYNFALDFTPTEAFTVEANNVEYDPILGAYKLYFTESESATSYNIYITDDVDPEFQGSVFDLELQGVRSGVYIDDIHLLVDEIVLTQCPVVDGEGEVGYAYYCDGEILYIMYDERLLLDGDYYFAVTSLIDDTESQIDGFVYT